ncbi:hypothetical protein ACFWIB_33240 [Streptomyces sp. NPDC127051]|uniref:hypothetical protein n=1 Tax=Streptomyces sp. NPDC127051 TaxID=3347119 RepID=UPI00365537A3
MVLDSPGEHEQAEAKMKGLEGELENWEKKYKEDDEKRKKLQKEVDELNASLEGL